MPAQTPQQRKAAAYAAYSRSKAQRELRERLAYAEELTAEMASREYDLYADDPQGADPFAIMQADAAYLGKVLAAAQDGTGIWEQVA